MVTEKEESPSEKRPWSSIPIDILHLILSRLSWSNHPGFSLVCKHWRSTVSPFYPAWITPVLLNTANVGCDRIQYYSPYFNKNFEVEYTSGIPRAKLCCATGDCLTLCRPYEVIVANLITGSLYKLPPFNRMQFDFSVYDEGEMFGVSITGETMESACCTKYWYWSDSESIPPFIASPVSNPIFHKGVLYCLGEKGNLAVYNPAEWQKSWKVLPKPQSFGFACEDCYLVDSEGGELMSILIGRRGTPIHVLKLNEELMEWEKVERLEGQAVFTGTLTTVLKKTALRSMENKVFLPRFYGRPETIRVELISSNGEVAFVPKSLSSEMKEPRYGSEGSIWCYELGQEKYLWETRRLDYSIWVDFSSNNHFTVPKHWVEFSSNNHSEDNFSVPEHDSSDIVTVVYPHMLL